MTYKVVGGIERLQIQESSSTYLECRLQHTSSSTTWLTTLSYDYLVTILSDDHHQLLGNYFVICHPSMLLYDCGRKVSANAFVSDSVQSDRSLLIYIIILSHLSLSSGKEEGTGIRISEKFCLDIIIIIIILRNNFSEKHCRHYKSFDLLEYALSSITPYRRSFHRGD